MRKLIPFGAFCFLSACTGSNPASKNLYPPPDYARMSVQGWEVRCGNYRMYVNRYRMKQFYKRDGSLKTQGEFCSEESTNSKIIKKRPHL